MFAVPWQATATQQNASPNHTVPAESTKQGQRNHHCFCNSARSSCTKTVGLARTATVTDSYPVWLASLRGHSVSYIRYIASERNSVFRNPKNFALVRLFHRGCGLLGFSVLLATPEWCRICAPTAPRQATTWRHPQSAPLASASRSLRLSLNASLVFVPTTLSGAPLFQGTHP